MKSRTVTIRLALSVIAAALVAVSLSGAASASSSERGTSVRGTQPSVLNGSGVKSAASLHLTAEQRTELDKQVADQLRITPGAERISLNEVAWTEGTGKVVMTFAVPGIEPLAAADCPFQWVCVYNGATFNYPRAAYFNCGTFGIPSTIGVSSWHNNQTNGTESTLFDGAGVNLQVNQALSKVSYVGAPSNDRARSIHVC